MIGHQNGRRRRCVVTRDMYSRRALRTKSLFDGGGVCETDFGLRKEFRSGTIGGGYDSGDGGGDDNERQRSRRQDDCVRTDATAVAAKQPLNDRAARHRGGQQRR